MSKGRRIVFYELNEVPNRVLRDFADARPESAIATLLNHSSCFETLSPDRGSLSPWITWPTVHRGVSNKLHCISNFGEDLSDVNEDYPSYLTLLARAGIKVGVFGSLHTYPLPASVEDYSFYMPDTFANGPEAFPPDLSSFQEYNLAMVDSSARNVAKGVNVRLAKKFVAKSFSLGVSPSTAVSIAEQIIAERLRPSRSSRRRVLQGRLSFDIFYSQMRKHKPDMCTFFTNHLASSMHRYWPARYPGDYKNLQLPDEWRSTYRHEIDAAMSEVDRQLGLLLTYVRQNKDTVLIIAGSMGQAPVDRNEIVRTQLYIQDPIVFMRRLGCEPYEWEKRRSMLPRYVFQVSPDKYNAAWNLLSTVRVGGKALSTKELGDGMFEVHLGHANLTESTSVGMINSSDETFVSFGLLNTRIEDETGAYAYHVPEGIMLVFDPMSATSKRQAQISTDEIAPSVLRNFGISSPSHMQAAFALS